MQAQNANPEMARGGGFASILASLTAPHAAAAPRCHNQLEDRLEDQLEEDVATLSYERALKTHARYRPPTDEAIFARPTAADMMPPAVNPETEVVPAPGLRQELKCASITIRMSQAECDQVRQRAAAAGMTVSAYLRSCTLEAENLRAMVRQTMAELRASADKRVQPKRDSFRWLRQLFALAGRRHALAGE